MKVEDRYKLKVGQEITFGKAKKKGTIICIHPVNKCRRMADIFKGIPASGPEGEWHDTFGVIVKTTNSKGNPIQQEWGNEGIKI